MPPSPPAGLPAPGARIGRFLLLEQIGQGGMGIVFRAREENLNREVALKVIAPLYAHDPEFRERFTREAQAQASLESSHVVAVYAHGEEDGYLYLASQLVPDGDLGHLLNRAGVPPLADGLDVIEQTATGLYDAHSAGLIHRDLKPGNVLVRLRGNTIRAYLCDFGIARRIDAAATRFSRSGVGTPNYMAPELHSGASAGIATDIYSLGCVLWAAVTGTPPYSRETEYQVVSAHVNDPAPQLPGDEAMVHATNRILRIAMAKDPAERYDSAAAMRADIQAALRMPVPRAAPIQTAVRPGPDAAPGLRPSSPVSWTPTPAAPTPVNAASPAPVPPARLAGTPAGPGGGARRPSRRRTWWILGGVGVLVAVGGGAAAALISSNHDDGPTTPAFVREDPRQIVIAADKEMAVLDSARVRGDFKDSSYGQMHVDMIATGDGDCSGSMTQGNGGRAQILAVSPNFYVKPNAKFLESDGKTGSGDTLLKVVGSRWILMNSLRSTFDEVCDLDKLLERDGRDKADDTNQGVVEVDGEDAVKIREDDTDSTHWDVVYVRVDDPHYMIRMDGDQGDVFRFSEFNSSPPIQAPPKSQVFDLQSLLKQLPGGG